ncbi:helix-turn-helix domain-containing protein [Streptomyces sp. NPDC052052]|uniref:helix-turn-helix domain-containing protein n=1 Tax=Streptomyces sp. NPDC052052 TaxID=3154756 RepID=UPI00343BAF8A
MTAITTAEAATEARVTVATIRTWCRNGAVAAVKRAGRWVIDTASLAHRITIGAMKRPPVYTIYYRACRHTETDRSLRRNMVSTAICTACRAESKERAAKAAAIEAAGGRATARQISYLATLTGKPASALQGLTKPEASRLIDDAKHGGRGERRSYRCDCPSGRHGGVCTCC